MPRIVEQSVSWRHLTGQLDICTVALIIYWADVRVPVLQNSPWWRLDIRVAAEIRRLGDDRSFGAAETSGKEAAYKDYLAAYPAGLHAAEATVKGDDAAFREAGQQTNLAA